MKWGRPKHEPLLGMAFCAPCKRGAHLACTKRAIDEMTGDLAPCFCHEVGHRSRRSVREELDNDR